MKKTAARRSSLFLLELVIAILFFALASAVCIQVFVQSHLKTTAATELTMALSKAQSAAEGFYAADGNLIKVQALFPDSEVSDLTLTASFDSSWNACPQADAAYRLTLTQKRETAMYTGTISVVSADTSEELSHLETKKHPANRRASYEP